MDAHTILLVTQYDGERFAGWQRQPHMRTVQGEIEEVLARLCGQPVSAVGAGRTDAGVHAHGQGVGVRVSGRWDPTTLRRAMNALLPADIWIASAHAMSPQFHPRRSAIARRYRYLVGTDAAARSPFRRRLEWAVSRPVDGDVLTTEANEIVGAHVFRAFAVANTAPQGDDHQCVVRRASWTARDGGWVFEVEANRFLHHMVRFLVGTMIEVAVGRLPVGTMSRLLSRTDNRSTPRPAPAHGLSLQEVTYPASLYLERL